MKLPTADAVYARLGAGVFLGTVLIGYSGLLFTRSGSTTELLSLLGLGVIYVIFGVLWFERLSPNHAQLPFYFVTQLAIATAIVFIGVRVSDGAMWIVPLPLVSHAFVSLPRPRAFAVAALIVLLFGVVVGATSGFANGLRQMLNYLPSAIFVAVFSILTVDQARARLEMEKLATQLREANIRLSEYATQVEELATTRERNRLAREVHDSLGHYLTAANMQLEAARAVLDSNTADTSRAREGIATAQRLTRDGLNEVRRSVAALRAGPLETRTLRDAIGKLVEESRGSGLQIDYAAGADAAPDDLSPQRELLLYRAAQEGLTNVRKHSNATRVWINLDREADHALLTVRDNGAAKSTPADAHSGGGIGLTGLRERAQLLGGVVETQAGGDGFVLHVRVPIQA
jgi:signal transduction histidine kinase